MTLCFLGLLASGCSPTSNQGNSAAGGSTSAGGNTGAGGTSPKGGSSGRGGTSAQGGSSNAGGNTYVGGTSGAGGSGGSGGANLSGGVGSGGTSSGGKGGSSSGSSGGQNSGGTSGQGGGAGSGGTSGQGGSAGSGGASDKGGSAGSGGTSGTGGVTTATNCAITPTGSISSKIGTVGIVTFTTDLASPTSAHIDFGLDTKYGMKAPVDLSAASYRTLLLGMKQSKTYHYRIVVANASGQCTGSDNTIVTKTLPNGLPTISISAASGTIAGGYLNSCFFQGMGGGSATGAFILDADGEYVWVYGSGEMGRAEMSYDGKYMYYASVNAGESSSSSMHRVTMDGLTEENFSSAVSGMHHDFTTSLPDGTVGFIRRVGSDDWVSELKDGAVTNRFDVTTMMATSGIQPHANSIHYHADDDSYTVSDRDYNAYIKSSRSGTKAWKLGGSGGAFTGDVTWSVNHGHQWIGPNRLFFFNNGSGGTGMGGGSSTASHAIELSLDLTTMKASKVWDYSSGSVASSVLGDVQILDNGNRLVTFSTAGVIHEVDSASKSMIQSISFSSGGAIGYAVKRASLYGPPPTR